MNASEAIEKLEAIKATDGHETICAVIDVMIEYLKGTEPPSTKAHRESKPKSE